MGKPKKGEISLKISGETPLLFSTVFTGCRQNSCKDDKPPKTKTQEILQIYKLYYALRREYLKLDSSFSEAYNTFINCGQPKGCPQN
jgi:hypothetical protein